MIGILILASVASAAAPSMSSVAVSQGAFIENQGQWNSAAKFLMKSPGANLWVTESGAVIDYYKHSTKLVPVAEDFNGKQISTKGDVVRVNFVGASKSVVPLGVAKKTYQTNFIVDGNEFNGVGSFNEAKLVNVLPGVTARYYVDGGAPRYDVILAAGAKPESVKLKYEGAKNLRVGADGSLQYDISLGTVREQNLFVYQMVDGVKKEVAAKFTVNNGQVGFKLAGYDASKPVVIDPQIFLYGTYLGGSGTDETGAVAVSPSGAFVVAGLTAATNFPTTVGPYNSDGTDSDWYISHLKSDLSGIDKFSTYVSGSGNELGWGSTQGMKVRVLNDQDVVLAANTPSTNLPATLGVQTANAGQTDGYVLRLRSNGGTRAFSTYVGGDQVDLIWDMDVNPTNGEVALAIQTGSANLSSAITSRVALTKGSAADTSKGGSGASNDAFVLVLNKKLSAPKLGSFLGGTSTDAGKAVKFGRDYNTVVLGAQSQSSGFSVTTGAISSNRDLLIARFAMRDAAVQFSLGFGSSTSDTLRALQLDPLTDRPYIAALIGGPINTAGFGTTIPVQYGYDSTSNGVNDAIVALLSQDLSQLNMTYYGGTSDDAPTDIALQTNGSVHVIGTTQSAALPLNSAGGTNITATAASTSNIQGFHARFSNGLKLQGASLLGGTVASDTGTETPYGIALFGTWNNAVIVGQTASTTLQTSPLAFQPANIDISGFIQVLAFYTDPTAVVFSSNSLLDTETNFAEVRLNAPVQNVLGQNVVLTLTPTTAARFSNGTSTITLNVPQGRKHISTKIFGNAVTTPTLVTVTAVSSGTTVSGSYTINP